MGYQLVMLVGLSSSAEVLYMSPCVCTVTSRCPSRFDLRLLQGFKIPTANELTKLRLLTTERHFQLHIPVAGQYLRMCTHVAGYSLHLGVSLIDHNFHVCIPTTV